MGQNLEVEEEGWTLQFKCGRKWFGGGDNIHRLWIGNRGKNKYIQIKNYMNISEGGVRFNAIIQLINWETGEESMKEEQASSADGERQLINYERKGYGYDYVRFNVTLFK